MSKPSMLNSNMSLLTGMVAVTVSSMTFALSLFIDPVSAVPAEALALRDIVQAVPIAVRELIIVRFFIMIPPFFR